MSSHRCANERCLLRVVIDFVFLGFFLGPNVLPKKEIEAMIKDFLYQQLEDEEAGLTACLVIHTVNKPLEKVN